MLKTTKDWENLVLRDNKIKILVSNHKFQTCNIKVCFKDPFSSVQLVNK